MAGIEPYTFEEWWQGTRELVSETLSMVRTPKDCLELIIYTPMIAIATLTGFVLAVLEHFIFRAGPDERD